MSPRRARVTDPAAMRRAVVGQVRDIVRQGRGPRAVAMHPDDVQAIRKVCNQPFRAIVGIPLTEDPQIQRGQFGMLFPPEPDPEPDLPRPGDDPQIRSKHDL